MDYEVIGQLLGNPGRYAAIALIMVALNWIDVGFNHMLMAVYGATPAHHCKLPPGYNYSNQSIPQNSEGKIESCVVYVNYTSDSGQTMSCQTGWIYELQDRESTVVTEWDLVCERKYLIGVATSMYFVGAMISGQVLGILSDRLGRKPVLLLALYMSIGLGLTLHFVDNFVVFIVIRFLTGGLMQAILLTSYVMGMEVCIQSKTRTYASVVYGTIWSIGIMILSGVAFLLKNWRHIQLAVSLLPLITLLYIWFIPESLRWLVIKKKYERAETIIRKAAKFNNVRLPDNIDTLTRNKKAKETGSNKVYNILDMFRTPKLRARSLILSYMNMAAAISSYGIAHLASKQVGNKYLNYFISGAVELPSAVLNIWTLNKFGRSRPISGYLVISGIASIISGTIPKHAANGTDIQWVSSMFAWIGKFGATGAWSAIILCASEMFPTVIRNTSVAACSFWGGVGSILAPQIITLGEYTVTYVPILIFGSTAVIAGILAMVLPETLHEQLPDTIEDAENILWPWQKKKATKAEISDHEQLPDTIEDAENSAYIIEKL